MPMIPQPQPHCNHECECPYDNENTTMEPGMNSTECKASKSCAECIFNHAASRQIPIPAIITDWE